MINPAQRRGIVFFLAILIPANFLMAVPPEDFPPQISALSDYYQVESSEPAGESGFLNFRVSSKHAQYEVEGYLPLIKLLHEIEVIEKIRRNEQTSGFFDGASASIEATGQGVANLVTHPVNSAKGLGKATGKIGRSIGGIFRKKQAGEKSSFGEKFLGSEERALAKQFDVDVYTDNPYLKALLANMARSRAGGKSAVMVLKLLIPVAAVASIALAAGGINGAADELIHNSSRGDLYRMNREAFLAMGFSEKEAGKILDLPWYSPTEATYLRFYLEKLKSAEGMKDIFKKAASVSSKREAYEILYSAQLAASAFSFRNFVRIQVFDEGLFAEDSGGAGVFFAPYDRLEENGLGGRVMERVRAIQKESSRKGLIEIENGGSISPEFQARAEAFKFKTHEWVYFKPGAVDEAHV